MIRINPYSKISFKFSFKGIKYPIAWAVSSSANFEAY